MMKLQWWLVSFGFAIAWDVALRIAKTTPLYKDMERLTSEKKRRQVASYTLSLLHAIVASTYGWYLWYFIMTDPDMDDRSLYFCEYKDGYLLNIVLYTNASFMGYLLADLTRGFLDKTLTLDAFIHHVVFFVNCVLWQYLEAGCYGFIVGVIGETSTIFVDLRWFFIATGFTKSKAFDVIQYTFALTFFITRVCFFPVMVYNFVVNMVLPDFTFDETSYVPIAYDFQLYHVCVGLLGVAALLNMYWFTLIAGAVVGKASEKPEKATKQD
jgi:hypothetical protein